MARRIKRAKIHTIALCRRGANRLPGIYKSKKDDKGLVFETIVVKSSSLLGDGLLTCVVYAPERVDTQNDVASAEVIKGMAHGFFKEGGGINVEHDGKTLSKEDAYPAESFVIQKGDPRFANIKDDEGKLTDVTGGWGMILKLENDELRKKYASGKWNGVSMEGAGEFEAAKAADFGDALADRLGSDNGTTELEDMDAKELAKMVAEEVTKAFALEKSKNKTKPVEIDAIAKSVHPTDVAKQKIAHAAVELAKANGKTGADLVAAAVDSTLEKTGVIAFEGSRSNPDDLKKHAKKLEVAALMKSVDFSDPKAVAKFAEDMAESDEELDELEKAADVQEGDSDEVRKLKLDLFKAEKGGSNQNRKGMKKADVFPGMTVKESSLVKQAEDTAAWLNKSRGVVDSRETS